MKRRFKKTAIKFNILTLLILFAFISNGCTKKEGYGGKSTIYGKVLERKYNNSGQFQNEYYVSEQKVYIIFGDEDFYSDEVRTDYEGKFKFSFLYAGNYRIYSYSECSPIDPCDSGVEDVMLEIKVLNNGDVVITSDLVIENW